MWRWLILVFVTCLPGLVGCGYAWVGAGSDASLGRIAIETPNNRSEHGGVDVVVADALRREVLRRPGAELVDAPDRADWVVSGTVLPLEIAPVSFSSVVLVLEYQVTLSLALQATGKDGALVNFSTGDLTENERFLASADVEALRVNRGEALRRASRQLASRALDALGEASLR